MYSVVYTAVEHIPQDCVPMVTIGIAVYNSIGIVEYVSIHLHPEGSNDTIYSALLIVDNLDKRRTAFPCKLPEYQFPYSI